MGQPGTGSQSGSAVASGTTVDVPLTDGALFPAIDTQGYWEMRSVSDDGSVTAGFPKFAIENTTGGVSDYEVAWRYINA